jgi:hypothetical protein
MLAENMKSTTLNVNPSKEDEWPDYQDIDWVR